MSTATNKVCDQCKGVIPDDAQYIRNVSATFALTGGEQAYSNLDFCCTSHLVAYLQGQPTVADPPEAYQPIP